MKLNPYPLYKDSEIQWIGEIPEHWEVKRIKDYLSFQIGGTPSTSREDYFEGDNIWVAISDLNDKDIISDSKIKISNEAIINSNVKRVSKGSLLFSFKLTIGLTAFAGRDLYTNEAIASFSPNENVSLNFLKYVLQKDFENNGYENIYGAKLLNTDLLGFAKYALPPDVDEQEKIANFLDERISKINRIIKSNEKIIKLFREKITILINNALTKGISSNIKMINSGISWIEKIPENWEIHKLKFLVSKIGSGKTPKGGATVYVDEGIPLIRSQNIHFDGLKLDDVVYITEEIYRSMLNTKVREKDVLLNITGASIGRCTFIENQIKKANVNQHVCIIRPNRVYYKFLNYFLMSDLGQDQIFSIQMGASREGLNFDQISNFNVLCPEFDEQEHITNYLDEKIFKINAIIKEVENEIEFLKEYKKSLIHHVITGKVDVRGDNALNQIQLKKNFKKTSLTT